MHRLHALSKKVSKNIALIISELGELYHVAAIISYLDYVEYDDLKFHEDDDIKFHLENVGKSAKSIINSLLALSTNFSPYQQHLDTSHAVESAEEIVCLVTRVKNHRDIRSIIVENNSLMESADKLSAKIQQVVTQSSQVLGKIMPIQLSSPSLAKINYTDIERNPQANVQLAFTNFESHLRNRIEAGSELFGEGLINAAFSSNGGLKFGETPSEQLGTRNFISGAYAVLRNPRMHRIVPDDEKTALKIIAVVDLLIEIIDKSKKSGIE